MKDTLIGHILYAYERLGLTPLNAHNQPVVIGGRMGWKVSANASREELDGIPPFHFALEWLGWPAGLVGPLGDGFIAAGGVANEASLIAWLDSMGAES